RGELWRGALQTLAHMALFRDWELHLKEDDGVDRHDAGILADRVRQLTRWKLNFLVGTVDSRFWELMQTLSIHSGLLPLDSVPGFLDGVKDLVHSWGYVEARPHVAGALG